MPAVTRRFIVEVRAGASLVRLLDPDVELFLMHELQDEWLRWLMAERPSRVVVDFSAVRRCPTEVINAMLRGRKRLLEWEGALRLAAMRSDVREVFRVLNLDGTVFEIDDDVEQALRALDYR